jgi:hypothetical protein
VAAVGVPQPAAKRRQAGLRWPYLPCAVPPLLTLIVLVREGVNLPFQDEWDLVPSAACGP